ncbi:hypothetical protein SMSP2_00285 [Limihaloglobus sulfuriphilus]|uniref:Zinc-ribbon domain-containing protein n=1 Tax=Limihaloglobus sulfuriphilus TaxID=1851148 RepID=A0A1Q2MB99_9BACT|nr:hypothetical protein [Limihaloglobus sulfuriphilus]AQQ69951.1 hypothetical protein SMSP2_00285 [Limihaloglobus sulfuriphilus]
MFNYRNIGSFRTSGFTSRQSGGRSDISAQSQAASNQRHIRWLEDNLSRTLLLCETLWELLRDEHGWTDEKLTQKLEEIDLRDGTLDGKHQQSVKKCTSCGRTVAPRHKACIYCGREVDKSAFSI